MVPWLRQAPQGHEMYCMEHVGSGQSQVELEMHSTSVKVVHQNYTVNSSDSTVSALLGFIRVTADSWVEASAIKY